MSKATDGSIVIPKTYSTMQVECVNQLITQDDYELPKAVHYCAGGNL